METQISTSELATCGGYTYTEKAWHLASILLFLGRPASVHELSGRCSLFRATPEIVAFFCSIPNSPLRLTANSFVVLSMSVFVACGEFFASSMPKIEFRLYGAERMLRCGGDVLRPYLRKRKRLGNEMMPVAKKPAVLRSVDEYVLQTASSSATQRLVSTISEGVDLQGACPITALNDLSSSRSLKAVKPEIFDNMVTIPSVVSSSLRQLEYQLFIDDQESGKWQNASVINDMDKCVAMVEHQDNCCADEIFSDLPNCYGTISRASLLKNIAELSALLEGNNHDLTNMEYRTDTEGPFCVELNQHDTNLVVEPTAVTDVAKDFRDSQKCKTILEDLNELPLVDDGPEERAANNMFGSCIEVFSSVDNLRQTNMDIIDRRHTSDQKLSNIKLTSLPLVSAVPSSSPQKSYTKSLALENVPQDELNQKQQTPCKSVQHHKVDIIHKEQRGQKHRIVMAMMDKSKHMAKNNASSPERCDNIPKSSKDQQKSKFPEFEPYTVEEEEGSGGYGTVYRARRNSDGLTFAIKCPHENAHKHHVKNELKMLERFGGKNFVIKYEGSLKSQNSDCFVLEHVDHDRPEVLKREIDIYQLQSYGYCMFRALVSLHKQGVFHRDIKPGNFLFSCKSCSGYLIDFNLAKDMNQKHGNIEKSQPCNVTAIQKVPPAPSKSTSPNKRKKILGGKSSELFRAGATSGSNRALETKTLKKKDLEKIKALEDLGRCNSLTSQGADGSGITSTRDMTSTRTPSADRLRKVQPLFCKGRKELISLAQKAMQGPNHGAAKAPVSNRKRVAASPGITDRKLIYPTPTPLHSSGVAISGAGSLKNRGDVKQVKDGPCAGTKGFRAPEVLLRSLHQGPKVDVWSAGVTLLYLISGRMPFNGDPEQNMKDIVKMKGNEELWEVAKLHNREFSFPVELLDIRYLQSMSIKDWYITNTKRQDLIEVIPDSLFDLLEKCLTVSPRLRITAEEALNHEFFAPCHDAKLKKRVLRRGQSQDSNSKLLPLSCEPVRPPKEKLISPVNSKDSHCKI